MNVSGVGGQLPGVTASGASPIAGGRFDGQWQFAMNDTSSLLGMTRSQLDASLTQASNLSAVAAGKGVSEQQLIDTIKQGLQQGGSQLTGARLDRIANRVAHQHHRHGSWSAPTTAPAGSPIASPTGPAATASTTLQTSL